MKNSTIHLSIVGLAVVSALVTSRVHAADAATGEYGRQQNVQEKRAGTPESRREEHKAQRAKVKAQGKNGELAADGEDWGMNGNRPAAVSGTHQTRAAERKVKRDEMKQTVKAGELPVSNEAGVSMTTKSP